MTTKRSSITKPAPEPEAPALGDPEAPPELFVIGPASAPMTPGWLMGIGSRPETAEEHAARLGAAAGKFNDAGFLLGNLEPRSGWPGPPEIVEPEP